MLKTSHMASPCLRSLLVSKASEKSFAEDLSNRQYNSAESCVFCRDSKNRQCSVDRKRFSLFKLHLPYKNHNGINKADNTRQSTLRLHAFAGHAFFGSNFGNKLYRINSSHSVLSSFTCSSSVPVGFNVLKSRYLCS